MEEVLQWFAVRTLFRLGVEGDIGRFEEKITMYRASDAEAALKSAKEDASTYLKLNPRAFALRRIGVYLLEHGERDLNGREVWSHVYQGPADPEKYYEAKYNRFELPPEEDAV